MENNLLQTSACVLIVEDDTSVVCFLQGLLSDKYDVMPAKDGRTALELVHAKGTRIDAVVLDYRLPDISGLQILREIKQERPQVPVIFITAYGDEDVAVKAFRYGAKEYLKKPFSFNQFQKVLDFSLSLARENNLHPRSVLTAESDCIASGIVSDIHSSAKYNMQKALIYIHDNYMNKLSLEKVADKACASRFHFSREFKQFVGCTYQEYITKLRIDKAMLLLHGSRLSVTEIAFSVGYTDLTNFERTFKKISGCTPRQYRNERKTVLSTALR